MLAKEKPEYYDGVIGTGQMVAFKETEEWYYYKAIEILECEGNTKMSEKLRETLINSFIDILRCENQTIQRTARSRYIAVRNGT